jgi:hypothetical protein
MPQEGFEHTTPVFERAKTVHALDCTAAVIGAYIYYHKINIILLHLHFGLPNGVFYPGFRTENLRLGHYLFISNSLFT